MKVLIIGLGSIAKKHIQALKIVDPDVEIAALRSTHNYMGDDIEGVSSIYSLQNLNFIPSFVLICNPTFLHYETIEKCLSLKCPIIIEKPVLDNTNGIYNLTQKIIDAGVLTYVACNLRFHPAINFLKYKSELYAKRIQEVNIYCGSFLPDWRPDRNYKEVYSANKEMGGGVHLDLIHEIDYCVWLFGDPLKYYSVKSSKSSLSISAVDYAHFNLEYANFFATITLNYYRINSKRTIEILFEDEIWNVDLLNSTITNHLGEIIFKTEFSMMDTYIDQAKYYTENIKLHTKMMNDFMEASEILKIAIK